MKKLIGLCNNLYLQFQIGRSVKIDFCSHRSKVINNIRSILREVESDESEQVVVYDLDELVAEDKMMGRLACDNSSLTNDDQDFVNNNEAKR